MDAFALLGMSNVKFADVVKEALSQLNNRFTLSQSALASVPLVAQIVLPDPRAASRTDWGQAVRILLIWGVQQLAPSQPRYPIGAYRPLDDPAWMDPAWWRYNILRHQFIEPIHPDEFAEDSGISSTLMARMGLPGRKRMFRERREAIYDLAQVLRQEFAEERHKRALLELACAEFCLPARGQRGPWQALCLAAAFNQAFSLNVLVQLAADQGLPSASSDVTTLIARRYLESVGDGLHYQVPTRLKEYLSSQQPVAERTRIHAAAAAHYLRNSDWIHTAWHLLHGGLYDRALETLITHLPALLGQRRDQDLAMVLDLFQFEQLAPEQRFWVHLARAAIYMLRREYEQMAEPCRQMTLLAETPIQQGLASFWCGNRYVNIDSGLALEFYEAARAKLPPTHDEYFAVLFRLADTLCALERTDEEKRTLLDILDQSAAAEVVVRATVRLRLAEACLRERQGSEALAYIKEALPLCEMSGESSRIAKANVVLARVYNQLLQPERGLLQAERAMRLCQQSAHPQGLAVSCAVAAESLAALGRMTDAVAMFQESARLCANNGDRSTLMKVHYQLVRLLLNMGDISAAASHWNDASYLAHQLGSSAYKARLDALRDEWPSLADSRASSGDHPATVLLSEAESRVLHADAQRMTGEILHRRTAELTEKKITQERDGERSPRDLPREPVPAANVLALARKHRRLTTSLVIAREHISRATAHRLLQRLTESGELVRNGAGRSTFYTLSDA